VDKRQQGLSELEGQSHFLGRSALGAMPPIAGSPRSCLFHPLGARTTVPMGRFRGVPSNRRLGELLGTSAQRPHICGTHPDHLLNPGPHGHWLELEGRKHFRGLSASYLTAADFTYEHPSQMRAYCDALAGRSYITKHASSQHHRVAGTFAKEQR